MAWISPISKLSSTRSAKIPYAIVRNAAATIWMYYVQDLWHNSSFSQKRSNATSSTLQCAWTTLFPSETDNKNIARYTPTTTQNSCAWAVISINTSPLQPLSAEHGTTVLQSLVLLQCKTRHNPSSMSNSSSDVE
jgi:hypothetical protein